MQGSQAGHPAIRTAQAARVSVSTLDGGLPAHADGETLCTTGQRLDLEILPKMLEVLVPGDS
jgi:diacylglycerol kinase family enzyme